MLDGVYPREDAQLEPLLDSVAVMTRLLEDLATLSTAEAGALRLHREPIAPARLVAEAVAAVAPRAEAKRVELVARSADLAPIEVDPVRIGQVLDNLIANALRWTPAGGRITVTADASLLPSHGIGRGARDEGDSVIFAVADTGPGIAPEQLPHVFDRYAKSADSGGSGLGLAIARRLVEAHAGEIWAHSDPGAGAVIAFRLPSS
jgi:signal transduction histidine kinase